MLGLDVERVLQAVGIEPRHVIEHNRVEPRGGFGVVVMREIRARDEKGAASTQNGYERIRQRRRGGASLVSHEQRHDGRVRRETAEKWKLHLERVLAYVSARVFTSETSEVHDCVDDFRGDRGDAEWRLESIGGRNGDAVEPNEMRRADEDDHIEYSGLQLAIGVSGNRTGVRQSGMRRNQRHEIAAKITSRSCELTVDDGGEVGRCSRIPAAGNGRPSDFRHVHPMVLFSGMSVFTKEQVLAVAALANLELEPGEVELFARQLGDVLTHAEELRQVDTAGVSPTAYGVAQETVDRPDVVAPSLPIAEALANAPEREQLPRDGGFFKVPRVIG